MSVRRRAGRALGAYVGSRALGWTVIVALVLVWHFGTASGWIDRPDIPPLTRVASKWWESLRDGTLLHDLRTTLRLMFTGYGIAAVVGVTLGVLMGTVRPIYGLVEPFFELLRPIPMTALVPLFILFLGIDDELKIFTIAVASLSPIVINSYAGVRSVSSTKRDTAATFGLSRWSTILEIGLRSALPSILVGLRLALSISMILAVFAEMTAGNEGMGYQILRAQQTLSVDRLYAGIFTLAVVGYALNRAALAIERRAIPWHASVASEAR